MPTITRDLPYYDVTYSSGGSVISGSSVVSVADGVDFVLPDTSATIDGGHYGVGPDFINFPTDIPAGYTLVTGCYVAVAYTEGGDTIPVDTTGWGYNPPPLTEPFLLVFGNGVFNIIDELPVGGYSGEIVQRASDGRIIDPVWGPGGTWRIAENLYNGNPAPPIHVDYLAVRLTYTAPDVTVPQSRQSVAPAHLRVYPRSDTSALRIWPPPQSRQGSNRLNGYL